MKMPGKEENGLRSSTDSPCRNLITRVIYFLFGQ